MSSVPKPRRTRGNGYPTYAKYPMPETDLHRDLMVALICSLQWHFRDDPNVYVSGNLLVFYEPGNRRRHISPDVFFVRGVEKRQRLNYLIWEEARAPQVVIDLTSSTTQRNDQTTKLERYRDVLKVREYFLFDPFGDYLDPRLQGYRLRKGEYHPIVAVHGRLPSRELGLHLERDGNEVRLWNPDTEAWLPTDLERAAAETERADAEAERARQAEQSIAELQRQLDELRRSNLPR